MSSDGGCRRTPGLIDRLVDGRMTDEDRSHAPACVSCGPVLTRAAAFEDELGRSARALVAEELPRGILDQTLGGADAGAPGRVVQLRAAPGFAAIVAAVAILLIGTVITLAPGAGPEPTSTPPAQPTVSPAPAKTKPPFTERFVTTAAIVGQLAKVGYSCNDGAPLASVGTEPDAVVKDAAACNAPDSIGPFMFAVIVGEASNGKVVELHVKADIVGTDDADNRALVAAEMAKVFAISLIDEGAGQSGGSWAKVHVPELEPGGDVEVVLRQVDFHATRLPNASYFVVVRGATAP